MWSYYGRKSKVIDKYPEPKCDTIIEPFAGTACYALHNDNWRRNVILRDIDPVVIRLWKWLQQTTPELIMCLPDVETKAPIPEHLPTEARWLTGFWSNKGTERPCNVAGWSNWVFARKHIAADLHKIRHWDIALADYTSLPNIKTTWFIDPPYQHGGNRYRCNTITDYDVLAAWCKSRLGQVIVCENTKADWLSFEPLTALKGQKHKTMEAMWYRYSSRRNTL